MKTKIHFFPIKKNQEKLQIIANQVQDNFNKEKKLLIHVPNEAAAKFVDELLWKTPADSFIPHSIVNAASSEFICISENHLQNLNQASCLINLCIDASPIYHKFEEIIEFFDETTPDKLHQSKKKVQDYRNLGLDVRV